MMDSKMVEMMVDLIQMGLNSAVMTAETTGSYLAQMTVEQIPMELSQAVTDDGCADLDGTKLGADEGSSDGSPLG